MVFKNMEEQNSFTLRNQERELRCFGTEEIEDFLEDMLVTPDQFVVLTAPKAQKQIRYVQACLLDDGTVETELGIEESDGTHLYGKICEDEECVRIFLDFFKNRLTVDRKEYKPVQF